MYMLDINFILLILTHTSFSAALVQQGHLLVLVKVASFTVAKLSTLRRLLMYLWRQLQMMKLHAWQSKLAGLEFSF
jgi:hypothetical protein